jgi:tRNA dimethylallyltransferase
MLLVIVGPTASGKSGAALGLAERFGAEIVSADSVQVYRGLDIGSAKPTPEERRRVPHHLIDVVGPDEPFDAARFRALATLAVEDIWGRGRRAIVAGGTGLYVRALLGGLFPSPPSDPELRRRLRAEAAERGRAALWERLAQLDPEAAGRIHPRDLIRVVRALEVIQLTGRPLSELQAAHGFGEAVFRYRLVGLRLERAELYRRIEARLEAMLAAGWLEETRGLLARYGPEARALHSLGYRHLVAHLEGRLGLAEARDLTFRDTRRYAKRQLIWFRAEPEITWLAPEGPELARVAQEVFGQERGAAD